MARRRYGGYHGRTTVRDVLKLVVALLVALLVLTAVALSVGQRYIVYTDEGVRLEIPFFRREVPAEVEASISLDIVQKPVASASKPEEQLPMAEEVAQQ